MAAFLENLGRFYEVFEEPTDFHFHSRGMKFWHQISTVRSLSPTSKIDKELNIKTKILISSYSSRPPSLHRETPSLLCSWGTDSITFELRLLSSGCERHALSVSLVHIPCNPGLRFRNPWSECEVHDAAVWCLIGRSELGAQFLYRVHC